MAATPIAAVDLSSSGDEASVDVSTYVAPDTTNGNTTSNSGGRLRLLVKNGAGTADTLSVTRVATVDGASLPAHDFAVPANKTTCIGPFPVDVFGGALTYKLTAATSTVLPIVTG